MTPNKQTIVMSSVSLLTRLRGWAYLTLMRLYFWAQQKAAWKAVYLKRQCCSLIDAEIRLLKPDLLQVGEDDELDLVVELVARELTGREVFPDLIAVRGDHRVAELRDLALASKSVGEVVSRYHATDAFFAGLLKDGARKTEQLALARSATKNHPEFDAGTIYREHTKTVKRLSILRKAIAERSALKVTFSIEGLSGSIALIGAIFLVAGFLHVHYFYGRMGVDVTLYFSVTDYLAASVEQIRAGAFAAVYAIIVFALGIRAGSLRSRRQALAGSKVRRREGWFVALFTLIICLKLAYSIYVGKPDFAIMAVAGLVLSYWLADYVAGAFFTNRLVAMTALSATMIFGVNVGVAAYERSEQLLSGSASPQAHQRLHFKDSSPAISGDLFGTNGAYYFIYSRAQGVTHIVPRERIAQVDVQRKPP